MRNSDVWKQLNVSVYIIARYKTGNGYISQRALAVCALNGEAVAAPDVQRNCPKR